MRSFRSSANKQTPRVWDVGRSTGIFMDWYTQYKSGDWQIWIQLSSDHLRISYRWWQAKECEGFNSPIFSKCTTLTHFFSQFISASGWASCFVCELEKKWNISTFYRKKAARAPSMREFFFFDKNFQHTEWCCLILMNENVRFSLHLCKCVSVWWKNEMKTFFFFIQAKPTKRVGGKKKGKSWKISSVGVIEKASLLLLQY